MVQVIQSLLCYGFRQKSTQIIAKDNSHKIVRDGALFGKSYPNNSQITGA